MKNIAVILTCFNRKPKTLSCLKTLFRAIDIYNNHCGNERIEVSVYLTDDGCTDGTADAITSTFPERNVTIIRGTGSLYWAGGMRLAWNVAKSEHDKWDYYLLLNDDVDMMDNLFFELFNAHEYSKRTYGKDGIYSGITCDKADEEKLTYGGDVWVNYLLGTSKRLSPVGKPQLCDLTNANILLVCKSVVDKIGIFWEGYVHGCADNDYSCLARKKDIPVVLTSNFCGKCEYDHRSVAEMSRIIISKTLTERKKFFSNPIHSNSDYIKFIRRNIPIRLPMVYVGRFLNVYFPKLYYMLNGVRFK